MDLRNLLLKILEDRKQRNYRYSLRALARDMEIDVSLLSRIINFKLTPSPLLALRVGRHLKLENGERLNLLEATIEEVALMNTKRQNAKKNIQKNLMEEFT